MEAIRNIWGDTLTRAQYRPLPTTSADALPLPSHAAQRRTRKAAYLAVLFPLFVLAAGWYWITSGRDTSRNPSYLIEADHGAVATENQLCSVIGVRTMKEGGNAVDAAVASTLCIGVVSMFS